MLGDFKKLQPMKAKQSFAKYCSNQQNCFLQKNCRDALRTRSCYSLEMFFLPLGHGAVQMLQRAYQALKNPECHCGLISLRFNVTNFPRPFSMKGNLGLVMKVVCAETRCTQAMRAHR